MTVTPEAPSSPVIFASCAVKAGGGDTVAAFAIRGNMAATTKQTTAASAMRMSHSSEILFLRIPA